MAASPCQDSANDLTCSICVDVFHDPVTLHCGHSYCRECLMTYADTVTTTTATSPTAVNDDNDSPRVEPQHLENKSKPAAGEDDKCSSSGHELVICCPVCRAPANIGIGGVAALSPDRKLTENFQQAQSGDTVEDHVPSCSMCEGEEKAEAVKVCSTCNTGILYCEECLTTLHPMRGPLKVHILISIDEYLCKDEKSSPSCPHHNKKFSDFCFTCQGLLCKGCLSKHSDHEVCDIATAYEKKKVELQPQTAAYRQVEKQLTQCSSKMDNLITNIKETEGRHIQEMEKAVEIAKTDLDKRLENFKEIVHHRYRGWHSPCVAVGHDLKMQTDRIRETLNKLTTTDILEYLQNATALLSRNVGEALDVAKFSMKSVKDLVRNTSDEVGLDFVIPKRLCITEIFKQEPLSTPTLQFESGITDATGNSHEIPKIYADAAAVGITGKFLSGKHYWELEICVNEIDLQTSKSVEVGIRSDRRNGLPGMGLRIVYRDKVCSCRALGCNEVIYGRRMVPTKPHRIGFCVDCEEKMLIIVDCDRNEVMARQTIGSSPPFFPAICSGSRCVPVCIVDCDSSTLPQVLRNMLERDGLKMK